MTVRNILSLGRPKPIPVYVWIPPTYSPVFKIEIVSQGVSYDVTDIVIEGDYTDGITETIGNFNFKIDNSNQTYSSLFSPYDQIKIYMDYATTATTLRFVGRIERASKSDNNLIISGKSTAVDYLGKNVTYAATDTARSTILTNIINSYFNSSGTKYTGVSLTTTNIESDTGTMTVNYFDKPFMEVVEEICAAGTRDFYIDVNADAHYFSSGSRQNTTEAIIHEYNILSTGDFSADASTVYNKIKVYGSVIGTVPVLATAEDSTSQAIYKVKELKINDTSIISIDQAQARADYELSVRKDAPTIGEVISLGLPTLQPGEQVRISDPLNSLNPQYYTIQKYNHKFSNDEPFQTSVTIQKERTTIPNILKKRIKFESEISTNANANELDYSHIFDFSTDIGTHSNSSIDINSSTGVGELTFSSANGTWTSPTVSLLSNVSAIEPRIDGTNLNGVLIRISIDGGINFSTVSSGSTSITAGKNVQIQLLSFTTNPVITSVGFLYSL